MNIYKITVKGKDDPRDDRVFLSVRQERREVILVWVARRYPDKEILVEEIMDSTAPKPLFN